jgi:hypothetical protein
MLVLRAGACEVNVPDHRSKKSDPLFQIPGTEKLEEEIQSNLYELRNGKIWFPEEIKRSTDG